jgi:hypothetical protein
MTAYSNLSPNLGLLWKGVSPRIPLAVCNPVAKGCGLSKQSIIAAPMHRDTTSSLGENGRLLDDKV